VEAPYLIRPADLHGHGLLPAQSPLTPPEVTNNSHRPQGGEHLRGLISSGAWDVLAPAAVVSPHRPRPDGRISAWRCVQEGAPASRQSHRSHREAFGSGDR